MTSQKIDMKGVQIPGLGHVSFKLIPPRGKTILIDPWTQSNPACPDNLKQVNQLDLMLVSHGHFDHAANAVDIAKTTRPSVVSIVELAGWLQSKGVENTTGINKGGSVDVQGINVTMTHAIHSSAVEDPSYVCHA